jgi:hypothetical protein
MCLLLPSALSQHNYLFVPHTFGSILQKPYTQELGGMLALLVAPCLASPYGHLRAKAAWVIGQYSDVQFPDGKCQGTTFTMFLQKVSEC